MRFTGEQEKSIEEKGIGTLSYDLVAGGDYQFQLINRTRDFSTDIATESHDVYSRISFRLESISTDIIAKSLTWNPSIGGLDYTYQIQGSPPSRATTIGVYWFDGTHVLGGPIQNTDIPARAPIKTYDSVHVPGSKLKNAPPGTSQLILLADPENYVVESNESNNTAALNDVVVNLGPNAKSVSAYTLGIIKDTLRASGQSKATISRTSSSIEDQARVMYEILAGPLTAAMKKKGFKSTVDYSYNLYDSNGDKVVDVYVKEHSTKTPSEVIADMAARIREIKRADPTAFKHTSDPNELEVVDIDPSSLINPRLVVASAKSDGRISRVLSPFEDPMDVAIHFEVPQVG